MPVPRRSKMISRQNDASVRQNRAMPGSSQPMSRWPKLRGTGQGRAALHQGPGRRSGLPAGVRTLSSAAAQPPPPHRDPVGFQGQTVSTGLSARPPLGPGGARRPLGVGDPEQHVSVAGLVELTPASDRLAAELGARGVLVQVTLEERDRFLSVVDRAGAVAAGLADRVSVRPATRPRDVHHAGGQALVVEVAFDADAIGHGRRLQASHNPGQGGPGSLSSEAEGPGR
jgi:hypothetical protein